MPKLKKPRSYSDFTLGHLREMFGLENRKQSLQLAGLLLEPSDWLKLSLEKSKIMPLNTEKAKSEWLVVPILTELMSLTPHKFNLFRAILLILTPLYR